MDEHVRILAAPIAFEKNLHTIVFTYVNGIVSQREQKYNSSIVIFIDTSTKILLLYIELWDVKWEGLNYSL